ncbi:hypothetical protein L873DRAFT_1039022 [Choiromyces venosus 120613-1]|uniref:Uncharacterized protein n=1 Tax=Choiromyces venosus 120613-1 TaxID=1336337 RepID=A0A3N4JJC4_9PEZI|nr:hypothetical protein L873DRAFT_1039022 [Choiromyces venosus 120613-1]
MVLLLTFLLLLRGWGQYQLLPFQWPFVLKVVLGFQYLSMVSLELVGVGQCYITFTTMM